MIKKNNELNEHLRSNDEQYQNSLKALKEHLNTQMESLSARYSQILSKIAAKLDIRMVGDIQNDAEVDEFLQCVQAFIVSKEESAKNQENFTKEIQNDLIQKKEALQFYQAKYSSLENERKELLNKAMAVKKVTSFILTVCLLFKDFEVDLEKKLAIISELECSLETKNSELARQAQLNEPMVDMLKKITSIVGLPDDPVCYEEVFAKVHGLQMQTLESGKMKEEAETKAVEKEMLFAKEKGLWELERQRLVAEKMGLLKEIENLKQTNKEEGNRYDAIREKNELADDLLKAIEDDLQKSKEKENSSQLTQKKASEQGWTISEKLSSAPLTIPLVRSSTRQKRHGAVRRPEKVQTASPSCRPSPVKSTIASELDMWAYSATKKH